VGNDMEKDGKLVIKNDKGEVMECDVLFTFDSDETGKSYIAYTDNTKDEKGNIKVYANIYDPNGESLKLEPITTEKEWQAINNILISVQEKVREVVEENGDSNK
jgi:uncharacterized protein YrzB (UPF0473 family)